MRDTYRDLHAGSEVSRQGKIRDALANACRQTDTWTKIYISARKGQAGMPVLRFGRLPLGAATSGFAPSHASGEYVVAQFNDVAQVSEMKSPVKSNTWVHDLIEIYNDLGGTARYEDVYRLAKERRMARGASWTSEATASIRRTVEDHAESSANFRGRSVFFSVNGHGRGVWGLMPDYLRSKGNELDGQKSAYIEGFEGIIREKYYLERSRDPRLAEARKLKDDYTCQICLFRRMVAPGKYIIDVHHLNPIGSLTEVKLTSVDDLVCLCPNCHRIAHTGNNVPLTLDDIRAVRLDKS